MFTFLSRPKNISKGFDMNPFYGGTFKLETISPALEAFVICELRNMNSA